MKSLKLRRSAALALLLVLALVAAACGSDTEAADDTEAGATADTEAEATDDTEAEATDDTEAEATDDTAAADGEPLSVTFMQGVKGDGFYISMACGAQEVADANNIDLDVQGPDQFDATIQNPMLDAVLASAPDALMVAPNDVEASAGPLERIRDAGIEVILVDTEVTDESIGVTRIASDNLAGGAAAADALAELIDGEGNVLVINVKPGISTTDQRQQGFEEQIATYDGITYIGTEFSQNEPAMAAQIVTAALAADPDLKGIFATNLFSAQGAATGLSQAGVAGDVKIVGFDAGAAQVEQLKNGDVQALVVQKPYEIGVQGIEAVLAAVNGEDLEPRVATGFVIATQENLSDPEIDKFLYKEEC